ncbi:hypothetical protein [Bacteroides salyersiae]|jgi:hypothetical protein|uniref:hypothetical protein n=1 Tax=Bacteroides salyersiae TaxID=291644 RepID=UPI001C8CE531|nr:hypothetical protein [Bacteroides salyersiae]
MKRLNCTRFALLLILVLGLGACGDDVYYTDDYLRNSDEKLCGKTWTEKVEADDNMYCVHQLKFSQNRSGQEIFEYYRPGESSPTRTETYRFSWEWIDQEMEGLKLDHGAGEVYYFENVWVRQNYLSGKLDGVEVTFRKE